MHRPVVSLDARPFKGDFQRQDFVRRLVKNKRICPQCRKKVFASNERGAGLLTGQGNLSKNEDFCRTFVATLFCSKVPTRRRTRRASGPPCCASSPPRLTGRPRAAPAPRAPDRRPRRPVGGSFRLVTAEEIRPRRVPDPRQRRAQKAAPPVTVSPATLYNRPKPQVGLGILNLKFFRTEFRGVLSDRVGDTHSVTIEDGDRVRTPPPSPPPPPDAHHVSHVSAEVHVPLPDVAVVVARPAPGRSPTPFPPSHSHEAPGTSRLR